MDYAVGQPGHDAEEGARVRGEDIAQVGSVKYVLERWEDTDPYWRAPSARDEPWRGPISLSVERNNERSHEGALPARIEKYQP